jgi:hypothetical protein
MAIIQFRTKIEVIIVLFFLLSLAIFSVASINRTITDSGDTIETCIRNSKGNIWDPTGANLQTAINDLSGQGGNVWVGSSITLSSEIKIENSIDNIIIDFQGNSATLTTSTTSFINLSNTCHVTVKNAIIKPHISSTTSIIKLYIGPSGGSTSENTFSYIHFKNQGGWVQTPWGNRIWADHNFTLIEMRLKGPGEINQNTFTRISADGPYRGIFFNQLVNTGWINGTYVDDLWLNQYSECIRFHNYPGNNHSFNYNTFCNVKTQTSHFTTYGITDISGYGNQFLYCLMWDWYACGSGYSNTGVKEYYITSDADNTFMILHSWTGLPGTTYVTNNGKNTMVITDGKVRVGG